MNNMNDWGNMDHLLLQLDQQLTILEKEKLRDELIFFINYLILHDFSRLVQILYRVDVDEQKLKSILRENPQADTAALIADLLIERQEQKIATRNSFKK